MDLTRNWLCHKTEQIQVFMMMWVIKLFPVLGRSTAPIMEHVLLLRIDTYMSIKELTVFQIALFQITNIRSDLGFFRRSQQRFRWLRRWTRTFYDGRIRQQVTFRFPHFIKQFRQPLISVTFATEVVSKWRIVRFRRLNYIDEFWKIVH